MYPYLFKIGGFEVGTYGLMMALGFLVGGTLLAREMKRHNLVPDWAWELILAAAVGGVLGARVLALLEDLPTFFEDPVGAFFSRGGLTWYGGFIFGTLGIVFVVWLRKLSFVKMADMLAPLLFLGYAFGRMGCFLSGDGCYGVPTDCALGMAFPDGLVPTTDAVHPTPLYEVFYSLVGFAVLWFWLRRKRLPIGVLFSIYLCFSAVARFAVEFIRRNDRYWFSFDGDGFLKTTPYDPHHAFESFPGFSLSQWISIGLLLCGVVWLILIWRKPRFDDPLESAGEYATENSPEPGEDE